MSDLNANSSHDRGKKIGEIKGSGPERPVNTFTPDGQRWMSGKTMRALIVDDQPLAQAARANILSARSDVEHFDSANDAIEALEGDRKAEAIWIHSDPSICAREYHVCGRDQAVLDGKVWSSGQKWEGIRSY